MRRKLNKVKVNKKVRNATINEYDGIKFKSKLELFCYLQLKRHNLHECITYESKTFKLFEKFRPITPQYIPNKDKTKLKEDYSIVRDMTYTPDFHGVYKNKHILIECKGMPNETWPIKWKFLRKQIDGLNYMVFVPHNQKQILDSIDIIRCLCN